MTVDLLVLGSGIAGLTAALSAAEEGATVSVLTKGALDQSATRYAQGGVAAALGPLDSPELHFEDTLTAGAGTCDVDAVRVLVEEGPLRVRELAERGARFDSAGETWHLTREGGHSLARVVHAGGAATGAEIERALVHAVPSGVIEVREGWFARDLLVERGVCTGVSAITPEGELVEVRAANTLLATGGIGQCFAVTTNPELSTGDGLAAALRAGVACADLEFVQFHPTALAVEEMPRPLLSEALRGEGAVLRDLAGRRFMVEEHPLADLAPRDIVSRAVHRRMHSDDGDHLWLDATAIDDFAERFPSIDAVCRDAGLDPQHDWLPIAPAAHYISGGVVADLHGATTMPGLWACGEVACSGVHGANRLASNSLLDGLVFGRRVAGAIVAGRVGPSDTGAMRGVAAAIAPAESRPLAVKGPADAASTEFASIDERRRRIQRAMSFDCGVERDEAGLKEAAAAVEAVAATLSATGPSPPADELRNLAEVAAAIVRSAVAREESRGTHSRSDHPATEPRFAGRMVTDGQGPPVFVPLPRTSLEVVT